MNDIEKDNVKEEVSDEEFKFIDREISWLSFNHRVIEQVKRVDIPYHERLTFIGIADSNLNEFVSVRFSEYAEDDEVDEAYLAELTKAIMQQKAEIANAARVHLYEVDEANNKRIANGKEEEISKAIRTTFRREIYAALSPVAVGQNKEIPRFKDGELNLFIKVKDSKESSYCWLQIPRQLGRIFKVKSKYVFIEDIILSNLNELFSEKKIIGTILFTVTKKYSEEVESSTFIPIIDRINKVLIDRTQNNILSLDVVENAGSKNMMRDLVKLLKVPKRFVFKYTDGKYLGLHYLKEKPFKKLCDEPILGVCEWNSRFKPRFPDELMGEKYIMDYLDDDDLIVHHPYESYDVVTGFIQEASINPNVISIKQTLYRVSSEKSPIIKALCNAARNGVNVTVMLELLARGDEKQNIKLISKLKEAGCTVVYSLEGLKTHCKMCIVTKHTKKGGITIYSHMGTGNYNEKTSGVYTDISYFSSRSSIGLDLTKLFNTITGFSTPSNMKVLSYSPTTLRQTLYDEMWKCVQYIKDSEEKSLTPDTQEKNTTEANITEDSVEAPLTRIGIKVNSLSDIDMVHKLYEISELAGNKIQIDIICRGICSCVPCRENIRIKSVVGRFLEHSRIYVFTRGKESKVYISSADLLTRNLDKRIETLIPINDSKCKKKVLSIFNSLLSDTANSWTMDKEGNYKQTYSNDGNLESQKYVNSQNEFTRNLNF